MADLIPAVAKISEPRHWEACTGCLYKNPPAIPERCQPYASGGDNILKVKDGEVFCVSWKPGIPISTNPATPTATTKKKRASKTV